MPLVASSKIDRSAHRLDAPLVLSLPREARPKVGFQFVPSSVAAAWVRDARIAVRSVSRALPHRVFAVFRMGKRVQLHADHSGMEQQTWSARFQGARRLA